MPLSAAWAQVTLSTDAAPDDIMAVAASYDQTLRYGAQTPFSDQMALHLEGGAWQVDQFHNSLIAAGNGSNHDVTARMTFFFDGGSKSYQIERVIPAQDQMWVDVGKLIRDRTPDKSGTVLPADLQTGAYQLMDISAHPTPSLYEGKVVTDKQWGHATYGCMVCCGNNQISQSPFGVGVGGDAFLGVSAQDSCSAAPADETDYFQSWSMNTAILTRNASTYMGHGMSLGQTNISAFGTNIPQGRDNGSRAQCPVQSATVPNSGTVVQPDHVSVIIDQQGYPAQCPATGVILRQQKLQVVDVNNNNVTTAYSVAERYQNLSANTCGNGQPSPSPCAPLNSGDTFIDTEGVSMSPCSTSVPHGSSCGYTHTSVWSVCSSGGSNALWTSPRQTTASSVTVNGNSTTFAAGTQLH